MDRTGHRDTIGRQPGRDSGDRPGRRDEQAFSRIVEAEHQRAFRLACLLAANRDAAEDAVAEAFARTFPRWQAGKVEQVGPYLRQAVHNEVKNQWRATRRRGHHEEHRRGDHRGAATPAGRITARHALLDLLDRLPPRQRAAIVLRYYADCSEADTAAVLGCRPGTVKSLVARGLTTLRRHAENVGLEHVDAGEAA